jgi:hypothetical protein
MKPANVANAMSIPFICRTTYLGRGVLAVGCCR